jgi:hypothetical protein
MQNQITELVVRGVQFPIVQPANDALVNDPLPRQQLERVCFCLWSNPRKRGTKLAVL